MKKIEGGILAAKGYSVASMRVGIKPTGDNRDLTLIKSDVSADVVGTFTRNKVKAAPVRWDMEVVGRGKADAIVINTGIANAATGTQGYENCRLEAEAVASALNVNPDRVLTASTGVIGPQIPVEKIISGINELSGKMIGIPYKKEDLEGGWNEAIKANAVVEAFEAAKAIMTTDTVPKEIALEFEAGGKTCHIGAMCKGSGMIHPNMGTMLGFILSDIAIDRSLADRMLKDVVEKTFNMVSVDGDTSTNDTVVWLSNGLAENDIVTEDNEEVYEALYTVCEYLAKNIASDGEGATRLFTAKVVGAPDYETARILAKSIITSNLSKAAIYGRDANCGRIFCAMGYSGADFDPDKTDITMMSSEGSIKLIDQGTLPEFSEEKALRILSPDEITALCDIHAGEFEATAWGCDLTHEYVTINADYRS
ncbi:MAG: bifunctional glutamate N-acetyltransferase/amino-acid acetyltransferase ArgJ [Eubacterium sp.]|nr:bifunctional glutamate N-acetyltransferase/amino-acid acetyltransferase ArgJ [Eubacterium sp.]